MHADTMYRAFCVNEASSFLHTLPALRMSHQHKSGSNMECRSNGGSKMHKKSLMLVRLCPHLPLVHPVTYPLFIHPLVHD